MRSLLFSSILLAACAAPTGAGTTTGDDALGERARPRTLPHPGASPWGGADASRWRPEATLANAASVALNRAWSGEGVTDAVVAIPLHMYPSDTAEYGDGQRNSVPDFVAWKKKERPPLVATLVSSAGAPLRITFVLDRDLAIANSDLVLEWSGGSAHVPLAPNADGDREASFTPPDALGLGATTSRAALVVRPSGWSDAFPIWFRIPTKPVSSLRVNDVRFADGHAIEDRLAVGGDGSPYDRLAAHGADARYSYFALDDVHGVFPYMNTLVRTAVGRGWTWLSNEYPRDYKMLYTCFEGRRADLEASAPNGGVATGGGWHLIGDPAETILNDVEAQPIVVASASTRPIAPSSGGAAYGLDDVATFRWLFPGEAFFTGADASKPNYHWFFFDTPGNVCTEEIVNLANDQHRSPAPLDDEP